MSNSVVMYRKMLTLIRILSTTTNDILNVSSFYVHGIVYLFMFTAGAEEPPVLYEGIFYDILKN